VFLYAVRSPFLKYSCIRPSAQPHGEYALFQLPPRKNSYQLFFLRGPAEEA